MPTNLSDVLSQKLTDIQSRASGLLTYREYAASFKDKLLRWSSGLDSSERLNIPVPMGDGTSVITSLTYEQYDQCISEAVDTITLAINSSGDTVTVAANDVVQAVQDQADSISLQVEFIEYNLSTVATKASDFVTTTLTKYRNLSADAVSSISAFIQDGDPGSTIQGFLATINAFTARLKPTQTSNEYIELVSPAQYTGVSVWSVVWTSFTDKVTSFFEGAWQGILKLGDFFKALGKGIVDAVKWLVSTAITPLTTRFDKTSAPIGISDLPVIQCIPALAVHMEHSERHTEYSDGYDYVSLSMSDSMRTRISALAQGNGLTFLGYTDIVPYAADVNDMRACLQILARGCFEKVDDVWYSRSYDITLPGDVNCDFIARIGINEDSNLCVQVFPLFAQSRIKDMHDGAIFLMIRNAFFECMKGICASTPCLVPGSGSLMTSDLQGFCWSVFANSGMVSPTDDNVDFVSHMPYIDPSYLDRDSNYIWWQYLALGLLRFAARYAPALNLFPEDPYTVTGGLVEFHQDYYSFLSSFLATSWYQGTYNGDAPVQWDTLNVFKWNADYIYNRFPPYLQNKPTPVAVHYQTTSEWAAEISHYLLAAVVAAAAIFITVKFVKFARRRVYMAQVQQGYVDNMSWTIGNNPTAEQLRTYGKARRKSDRMNRLNSALGLGSANDANGRTNSLINSVLDSVLATRGVKADGSQDHAPSLSDIRDYLTLLIKGLAH